MTALISTIIGVGAGVMVAIFGGAWVLSGRVSRVEQKVNDLPDTLNGTVIRKHEDRCANFTPVRSDPTAPVVPSVLV